MSEEPYAGFSRNELILRDRLAIDRTALANERTLLAYIRTALAVLAVGASALKFFDSVIIESLGWAFVVASGVTLAIGIRQFALVRRRIARVARDIAPGAGG